MQHGCKKIYLYSQLDISLKIFDSITSFKFILYTIDWQWFAGVNLVNLFTVTMYKN